MGDKNNVNVKPKVPVLPLEPSATETPATGGSATARAVLQNPRSTAKGGEPVSKGPNLSSSSRGEAEVDFFGMLNEEPPESFKSGPNESVRKELLEKAELSFSEVLKLGPPSDAQSDKGTSTTVKAKTAELEKVFKARAYSAKQIPGTPYKESRDSRPVAMHGKSASLTALRPGAAKGDASSTSSTTSSTTSTTSRSSAKDVLPGKPMPALPHAPTGGRVRSGSQPVRLFADLDDNPVGPGASRTGIIPTQSNYTAPRVTSSTSKPASTTAEQTTALSTMPATADLSRKNAADAELRRLANIAKSAHTTTTTTTTTSANTARSTSRPLANVTRASDPKVCFANPTPPGWKFPSLVVFSGSWFVTTQRYTQIGSRAGKSDGVLPAYESFVPGAPAEVTGDGKWCEVMVNFQRCAEVVNGAGKSSLSGATAKEIFRGNPKILWNGKEISVYEPMSQFVGERLKASKFFEYVNLVLEKIEDARETEREQFASDIAESFCSDYLLAKMPKDLVKELIHLDQEVIKWALDSGCAPGDIAAVRRDVAIVFLVTKGTTALMTQGDGDADGASAATSGGVLMHFGGLVAKAMKKVMNFPNSGTALSERILKMSLEQMMSAPSLVPDWKDGLEKLKGYEETQRRIIRLLESSNTATTNASSTATTSSSSATSATAQGDSSPGSKSNPKRAIRRAGTAGKILMPQDPDGRSAKARAEKKRLLKELYDKPWFKNKSDKLKKAIRGVLRELEANTLDAEMVQEKAEKCAADYQEKKRLIKELRGKAWFKDLAEDLSAAIVEALDDLDADGLDARTVEKTAREYAADYKLKSQILAKFYAAPAFQGMSEELKKGIRKSLEDMDADGLTEDKVAAVAEKFSSDLIGKWGRKSPQTSPEKASEDASEVSSLQSPSKSGEEGEKKKRS